MIKEKAFEFIQKPSLFVENATVAMAMIVFFALTKDEVFFVKTPDKLCGLSMCKVFITLGTY
jgi:hypothetical protein